MVNLFLSFVTVILFCISCYQLMRSATYSIPLLNQSGYAKAALRVEKAYKVFAWGLMSLFLLIGLVFSFYEVMTTI